MAVITTVITQEIIKSSWAYLGKQAYYFNHGDMGAIARYASSIDQIQFGDDIPVGLKKEIVNIFFLLTEGTDPEGSRQEKIRGIYDAISHHYGVSTEMAPDDIALDSVPLGWDHV